MSDAAHVSSRAARRWSLGHPWIFRSDVTVRPDRAAGAVVVVDHRGKSIGTALWSPKSEIALRMVDRKALADLDRTWWRDRILTATRRRAPLTAVANAYRVVHGEADACPSLVCDRYDRWLVVQLLSAGLEAYRAPIVEALGDSLAPAGILARNDVPVRKKEGLASGVELLSGEV